MGQNAESAQHKHLVWPHGNSMVAQQKNENAPESPNFWVCHATFSTTVSFIQKKHPVRSLLG